jgi:hypothetical protein
VTSRQAQQRDDAEDRREDARCREPSREGDRGGRLRSSLASPDDRRRASAVIDASPGPRGSTPCIQAS